MNHLYKIMHRNEPVDTSGDSCFLFPFWEGESLVDETGDSARVLIQGSEVFVHYEGITEIFQISPIVENLGDQSLSPEIKSPMPGKILKIMVQEGEDVKQGQVLILMEAMKMELNLKSSSDAKVESILAKEGEIVPAETVLLKLHPSL
jgi:acetyl/propionyl-CoA carboxylase alpha subunit